jgi:hypothetical protein
MRKAWPEQYEPIGLDLISHIHAGRHGFKIDAPVVPRLSRSICALAASLSA